MLDLLLGGVPCQGFTFLGLSAQRPGWSREATVVQVVTDDMPYLVDSVAAEFARDGVQVQRIVHPIVVVSRDLTGELLEVHPDADPADPPANSAAESWMYIEIDLVTDRNRARELDNRLSSVLGDVREVVEDTDKMAETARRLADELDENPPRLSASETAEGARLLRWLADGHFTFLGYRRYELIDNPHPDSDEPALRAVLATGLGVLRQDSLAARSLTAGPDTAASALAPTLLVLTQASAPSTVHRTVYPYYVGVKTFDDNGNVTGEHRFLGMFTTTALTPVNRRSRRSLARGRGKSVEFAPEGGSFRLNRGTLGSAGIVSGRSQWTARMARSRQGRLRSRCHRERHYHWHGGRCLVHILSGVPPPAWLDAPSVWLSVTATRSSPRHSMRCSRRSVSRSCRALFELRGRTRSLSGG